MSKVSYPQMFLFVLLSIALTLSLGFWLPEIITLFVQLFGFTQETVPHCIVLIYLVFVLCVAMPSLPRGSVKVEDKAVFITGCDTGFGFALAKHLHAQGFMVFAGCRLKDKNGEGAQELENMKCDRMNVLQLNVCSDEEVARAVESVKSHLKENRKGLWGVVNNASDSSFGEVEFTGLERYKELADINLWGTIRVTKAFLPLIRKATGRVVNLSSMFGCMGQAGQSTYCISKYGVEAFSDCLRYELQHWGVKVSIVEPGNYSFMTREDIGSMADAMWKESPDVVREDYGKSHFDRRTMAMKSLCSVGLKDFSPVVNAIADALTSKYPYRRYRPMEAYWWVRLLILTHLPAAIADLIYKC